MGDGCVVTDLGSPVRTLSYRCPSRESIGPPEPPVHDTLKFDLCLRLTFQRRGQSRAYLNHHPDFG